MGSNGSKGKKMKSGYPTQEGHSGAPQFQPQPQFQPHQQPKGGYLPEGADPVGRENSACQKQFNPGDETYRCIDCELTDDTPVLCRNCFEASEHRNHQWEMLRDEGGGWCDCGDPTAWREPFVFCTFHAPQYNPPPQHPAAYPQPAPGYPTAPGGYPDGPPQPGYPPQGYPQQQNNGYPPQPGYPQPGVHPPPAGGYPPQQQQPGYPPQAGGGYPPQPGYPAQPVAPPPQNPAYGQPPPYGM